MVSAWKRVAGAAAAILLASCDNLGRPSSGQGAAPDVEPATAQIAPQPDAQRTCTQELRRTPVSGGGASETHSWTETVTFTRIPRGYELVLVRRNEMDHDILRATLGEDGAVRAARLSGPGWDPDIDNSSIAFGRAGVLPERVVMGRSFRIGDALYTADMLRGDLRIIAHLETGLPTLLALQAESDVRFDGRIPHEGGQALQFAGTMRFTGSLPRADASTQADYPADVVMLFDDATGLLLESRSSGVMTVQNLGIAQRIEQTLDCTITSAGAAP